MEKQTKLILIKILLIIIAIGVGYLCFVQFQEKVLMVQIETDEKVLMVQVATDETEYSDAIQIQNALEKGGMIILNLDGDWLSSNLDPYYSTFGAINSDNQFFLIGGVVNFIANEGWHLIQGPSSGLSNIYYFEK